MKKLSWYYDQNRANKSKVCRASDICSHLKRDMLSYLPEPIRSHIVSFLPMKEATKTEVLSRRWRNTCTSLSHLEFHSNDFKSLVDFKNFVDKTLILHDGSDVRKFNLDYNVDYEVISTDHVNAWANFAIRHNVEEFRLTPYPKAKFERLPSSFFTCRTLAYISLKSFRHLKWPTSVSFPNLKHLDLQLVTFRDENVISKLFSTSGCPLLEKLSIFYCKFKRIPTLSISFPSLKYLQIYCEQYLSVNLSIPIVLEFDYECYSLPNICCAALSSMLRVALNFFMPSSISGELAFRDSVRRILMDLHNVKNLSLSSDIIEILSRDPDLLAYLPASYCRLKHFIFLIRPTKSHVETMACLLRTSPNLQTLRIYIEDENPPYSDINHRQGYWQLNELYIAECLKHLKHVKFCYFGGRESEIEIVRHLLRSASILEKIDISYSSEIEEDKEKRMKISEKFSSFRRVSPFATITFS